VLYKEGIYVGYRYYNTFDVKTAYPFGYGLSYTHFTYGQLQLNDARFTGRINATLDITNSGKVPGKEVVELYLSAPAKELKKPAEELKAFGKTRLLQPGQTEEMHFVLDLASLASFDTARESWIAEGGTYVVKAGASSTDVRQKASFSLDTDQVVEKDHRALVPKLDIPAFK
jgi:beta-glucosidase